MNYISCKFKYHTWCIQQILCGSIFSIFIVCHFLFINIYVVSVYEHMSKNIEEKQSQHNFKMLFKPCAFQVLTLFSDYTYYKINSRSENVMHAVKKKQFKLFSTYTFRIYFDTRRVPGNFMERILNIPKEMNPSPFFPDICFRLGEVYCFLDIVDSLTQKYCISFSVSFNGSQLLACFVKLLPLA